MSVRTVGSQFSLRERAAEVCWRKRKRIPIYVEGRQRENSVRWV
jgi:hypothetical protein